MRVALIFLLLYVARLELLCRYMFARRRMCVIEMHENRIYEIGASDGPCARGR